ncbi:UNVERIFIED_CONTAM: aminopeptidase P N-terminal domain-containing protein, partial [Bacteroidetes bacterium 56_B9]
MAGKLKVSHGFILLAATNARTWPNSDMPAPFRQDRYFYYLTGCNEADTFVTYDISKDKLSLWLPPINKQRVVWYGRGSTIEEALEKY